MDDDEVHLQHHILHPLINSANCSSLHDALESLIKIAKTEHGRSQLGFNNTVTAALQLTKFLLNRSTCSFLLSSLKLLRNLCAGEIQNQDRFVTENGVDIVSDLLISVGFGPPVADYGIVRTGLQLLGNVSLAGEEHQRAIWLRFFPDLFIKIGGIQRMEISDPLCMVIYTCCSKNNERLNELCGVQGLKIVAEIMKTGSRVGFGEEWLKLLLSKVCFEENQLATLFYHMSSDDVAIGEDLNRRVANFSEEQSFLLTVLSESLNQQTCKTSVSSECVMCLFGLLKKSLGTIDFFSRGKSSLPTGIPAVDVLGYSMTILRDICAECGLRRPHDEGSISIIDSLLSSGLLELLLNNLRDLEPPEIIRKSISLGENQSTSGAHDVLKRCPYKGYRRDIVAVIGNCLYKRKHAQDEIRQRNGILLLLQQCVTDDDNPFLREWGIWSLRNLLEGNEENQREVAELELQASVDVPQMARLGLRVELDQQTRRPKLINVP